jgi:hypothetical protein
MKQAYLLKDPAAVLKLPGLRVAMLWCETVFRARSTRF